MATLTKSLFKSCLSKLSINSLKKYASTYQAAILKQANETLEIEEQTSKKIKKNEVRVQVNYCSVNSVDCMTYRKHTGDLPFIPGYEISGEVVEIGKAVTPEQVIVGEKVVALSLEKFGGFAKECVVNIEDVWRIPSNLSLKDAAVLICGHSTAFYAFSKLQTPKEDEKVVVTAGPAGLGLAGVDVAANIFKAKVICVTDTEDRSELVRASGAFQTLKYHPKLRKELLKMTDGEGASLIYDAVGEYMLEAIGECVKPSGKIFHAAPVFNKTIPAPPPNTSLMMVSLHALRVQNPELYRVMVNDTLELADQGMIGAHISAIFDLHNINVAIKYIEDKKCTGKVVIEMD